MTTNPLDRLRAYGDDVELFTLSPIGEPSDWAEPGTEADGAIIGEHDGTNVIVYLHGVICTPDGNGGMTCETLRLDFDADGWEQLGTGALQVAAYLRERNGNGQDEPDRGGVPGGAVVAPDRPDP